MANNLSLDNIYVICDVCRKRYSFNQLDHVNNALECPECGDDSFGNMMICTDIYNEVIR